MAASYNAQDMIDAIRHAYAMARVTRTPWNVIDQSGKLKVVERLSSLDNVVVHSVTAPMWDAEFERAKSQAIHEIENIRPAMQRIVEIVNTNATGAKRSRAKIEEIVEETVRALLTPVPDPAWSKQREPKPEPDTSGFTRMFAAITRMIA